MGKHVKILIALYTFINNDYCSSRFGTLQYVILSDVIKIGNCTMYTSSSMCEILVILSYKILQINFACLFLSGNPIHF